jgi:hypothetical protein
MAEVTVEVEVGLVEAEAVVAEEQEELLEVQITLAIQVLNNEDYVPHSASMYSVMVREDLLIR